MKRLAVLLAAVCVCLAGCAADGGGGGGAVAVSLRPIGGDDRVPAGEASIIVRPMRLETEGDVKYLTTPRGAEPGRPTTQDDESGGRAVFQVDVPSDGVYTLYGRVFWIDGAGNSFWVKLDDGPYKRLGNDGKEGEWIYWKGPAWELDQGRHTLTVREREWGARVADLFLSPVPDYVTRATTFEDGAYTCPQPQLLVDPPYDLHAATPRFHVFRATGGAGDVRAAADRLPLVIKGPRGQRVYAGTLPAGQEAIVTVPRPAAGQYTITVGGQQAAWQWLKPRLDSLEAKLKELQDREEPSEGFRRWLPTLVLCRDNILRGSRYLRHDETYLDSLPYVLEQFAKAERIAKALARDKARGLAALDTPGSDERALVSEVDEVLSPYVLYLPAAYFKTQDKMPLVIYLHGANGTQWELHRGADSRTWKIDELRWPVVVPLARGNSGYAGPAEKDILQMIRELLARYRFDPDRLVVCGFSMGGGGTWRLVSDCPDMFEAAIPIAGYVPWAEGTRTPRQLPRKLRPRIIIVHGLEDQAIPIAEAEAAKAQLTERNIPFRFITHPGAHMLYPDFAELINGLYE